MAAAAGLLSLAMLSVAARGSAGSATPPPAVTPIAHGGAACATDWDCALGGVCNSSQACQCDVWFTGANCTLLNLQPAKPANGFDIEGWSSWGGHAVHNTKGGKWHGFFSLMARSCTLGAYRTNSGSVAATATDVDGPYILADPAQPDSESNWAVAPPSHCTQIKRHPSGEYHLWHILPGDGDGHYTNCTAAQPGGPDPVAGPGDAETHPFSQNLWIHTAPTPSGPWSKTGHQINITDFKPGTTAEQSWCSAPYYYPNGSAMVVWGGQGGRAAGGAGLWIGLADSWQGPYKQYEAAEINLALPNVEDPAIFRDPRGNLHMLTNANSGHAHCKAGGNCGGHSWSRDGLSWSTIFNGAFGPTTMLTNGSVAELGYVERPQVAQETANSPPLALFLGTGYTHRSYTWAQKFCDEASMAAGQCGFMGGVDPAAPPSPQQNNKANGEDLAAATHEQEPQLPPPPAPHISSNLTTTNVFWPGEMAADGTVFGCVYLPTMVLANETRLIVHGRCYTDAQANMSTECGGYHVSAAGRSLRAKIDSAEDLAPIELGPINLCQKHSDE
eukprot:SAG22_NODE_950_length_6352_cov_23.892212_6_plen_558_part_00